MSTRTTATLFYSLALFFYMSMSAANGADRYIYSQGSVARYCSAPATYSDGYYVIRDEPNVIRVNGFPVMSTSRAAELCERTATVSKTDPDPSSCCEPYTEPICGGNTHCPTLAITDGCSCEYSCTEDITRRIGRLTVHPKKPESCYVATGMITGIIPVPQICIQDTEDYVITKDTLRYACDEDDATPPPPGDCDDVDGCDGETCDVDVCLVTQKRVTRERRCEMCDRKGDLLIAIHKGEVRADVFIGKVGASRFPEYPTNMIVLRNRTEAQVQSLLQNPTIKFADIVADGGTSDLASQL